MPSRLRGTSSTSEERECGDWIEEYLKYVEHTEPPISYHRWVALGCIAAALQRRVYMDWGMERIYPNLYIILLGPAAQTRKSTALRIGEEIVRDISIPTIGQDNSAEAVIREIKKSSTNFNDGTIIRMQSAVVCFASELAVFLGRQDADFQAYLTDWYDSPSEWTRTTKHQGVDDISGLCFNLIGAMAPDWIPHVFTPESIGGGFTSRIVFVSEQKKAKTIANPNKSPPSNGRRGHLVADLQRINNLHGAYTLDKQAEKFYEDWYEDDDAKLQRGSFAVPDRAFHTYCGRRPTLLRKVSVCLSASRSSNMVVGLRDIEEALGMLELAEKRMPGTFASVGRSAQSAQTAIFVNSLKEQQTVLRSEFLAGMIQDMSVDEFDSVEKSLDAARLIKIIREENGDTTYKWKGERS